MGFTTPCFTRKDNEFIREKLKKLGYCLIDNDNQRDGLAADHGNMYSILNAISLTVRITVEQMKIFS